MLYFAHDFSKLRLCIIIAMSKGEAFIHEDRHYKALESMYLAAPINKIYRPTISVRNAEAEIEIEIKKEYFHSAGAVHGSVIFKMLDDAAFFAANSLETSFFVLTKSFTIYFTRPISNGSLRSVGRVVTKSSRQLIAESIAFDANGKVVGKGSGIFVRGKLLLLEAIGYSIA